MQVGQRGLKAGMQIRTECEEMNGVKENVEGVWTVMEMGMEEVTNQITAAKREVDRLGQGMKEFF